MNTKLYALIPARVQPGDIVLISQAAFLSFIIRAITISKFSHVAICTRPGMLLEAVSAGALRTSVFQTHAKRRKWLRVLRLKDEHKIDDIGIQVEDYAERMYGYGYSTRGAIATRIPFFNLDDTEAVFCSRLVVSAYAEYGVDLFPGKKLHKVVPGMFIKSSKLFDVTEQCVREVDAALDSELYRQITATAEIPFAANEMRLERQVFKEVRKRVGDQLPANVSSLPELRGWLSHYSPEARALDATIVGTLRSLGYDREMDTWLMSVESETQQLDHALSSAAESPPPSQEDVRTYLSLMSEVIALSEVSLASRLATSVEYQRMAQESPLDTIIYFKDLYQRQYDVFSRKHQTIVRLVETLRQFLKGH